MIIAIHKSTRCPRCGKKLDGATDLEGALLDGSPHTRHTPAAGDYSMCISCGLGLRFVSQGENLGLELLKPQDAEILFAPRAQYAGVTLLLSAYLVSAARAVEKTLKPLKSA